MMPFALRGLLLLTAAWLAALFDTGIAPLLELRHCAPSACLLAAVLTIALSNNSHAFLIAGGFGLTGDLSGASRLGPALGCFALAGYVVLRLRGTSQPPGVLRRSAELLLCAIAMPIALATVQALSAATSVSWSWLMQAALGAGLYTAALALPVLLFAISSRSAFHSLAPDS